MLFRLDDLRRIGEGEITLAFRRWRRPTVKAGGTLRTRVGVLAIDSVEVVDEDEVTDDDARRAGAESREAVLREGPQERPLYRIEFRLAGPDPRVALRERADISPEEREQIDARLSRLDAASRHGPQERHVREPPSAALDEHCELALQRGPGRVQVGVDRPGRQRRQRFPRGRERNRRGVDTQDDITPGDPSAK